MTHRSTAAEDCSVATVLCTRRIDTFLLPRFAMLSCSNMLQQLLYIQFTPSLLHLHCDSTSCLHWLPSMLPGQGYHWQTGRQPVTSGMTQLYITFVPRGQVSLAWAGITTVTYSGLMPDVTDCLPVCQWLAWPDGQVAIRQHTSSTDLLGHANLQTLQRVSPQQL